MLITTIFKKCVTATHAFKVQTNLTGMYYPLWTWGPNPTLNKYKRWPLRVLSFHLILWLENVECWSFPGRATHCFGDDAKINKLTMSTKFTKPKSNEPSPPLLRPLERRKMPVKVNPRIWMNIFHYITTTINFSVNNSMF